MCSAVTLPALEARSAVTLTAGSSGGCGRLGQLGDTGGWDGCTGCAEVGRRRRAPRLVLQRESPAAGGNRPVCQRRQTRYAASCTSIFCQNFWTIQLPRLLDVLPPAPTRSCTTGERRSAHLGASRA